MKLEQALPIARQIRDDLAPFCDRIEIAGSIRRLRPEVGDTEIVAIPRRLQADLLGVESVVDPEFCRLVERWEKIKGDPAKRYAQRRLPDGINLDLMDGSEIPVREERVRGKMP